MRESGVRAHVGRSVELIPTWRNTSRQPARCCSGSAPSKRLSISSFSRPWLSTTIDSWPSLIHEYCCDAHISFTILIV